MRESNLPEHRPKKVYVVKTNFLDYQNFPPELLDEPPTWAGGTEAMEGDAVYTTPQ